MPLQSSVYMTSKTQSISSFGQLAIAILICTGTGSLSAYISNTGMNPWFDNLIKPSWNPPEYLFGPVWTLLYCMMGISLWLVWKSETVASVKKPALQLFAAQLFLNFCWSIIFFKFHSPAWALVEIIAMLFLIVLTTKQFSKISKQAAWLLVPYIAWVSFASVLNFSIWTLNP